MTEEKKMVDFEVNVKGSYDGTTMNITSPSSITFNGECHPIDINSAGKLITRDGVCPSLSVPSVPTSKPYLSNANLLAQIQQGTKLTSNSKPVTSPIISTTPSQTSSLAQQLQQGKTQLKSAPITQKKNTNQGMNEVLKKALATRRTAIDDDDGEEWTGGKRRTYKNMKKHTPRYKKMQKKRTQRRRYTLRKMK